MLKSKASEPSLAPRSIDKARVIRRSMRCFAFGLIGIVPVLGTGLAVQALRLRKSVCEEMGESWVAPPVFGYWLLGLLLLPEIDGWGGVLGDVAVFLLILAAQTWHLASHFLASPEPVWNPARRVLMNGMLLAYAGIAGTLWMLAIVFYRLIRL